MRDYHDIKVELGRMTAALAVVEAHLRHVRARIEVLAEDTVVPSDPRRASSSEAARPGRRPTSANIAVKSSASPAAFAASCALERKAARQRDAIVRFQARHRLNTVTHLTWGLELA